MKFSASAKRHASAASAGGRRFLIASIMTLIGATPALGHVFIPKETRAGAYPNYPGDGWVGAVFLNLPNSAAHNTITAEEYIEGRAPNFTFRTRWIDFPSGPVASVPDADLSTIGDFFDDYIFEVSDPSQLEAPMSNMLVRFTGLLKVLLEDEVRVPQVLFPPTWIEFGSYGYDGFNLRVGGILCYEIYDSNLSEPWYNWGPAVQIQGLFPVMVTYLNRYDPDNSLNAPNAVFELYSWHGGGAAWPAGVNMLHANRGYGTLAPPWVIYQPGDELSVPTADYDANTHVDVRDFQWLQNCFFPPDGFIILPDGCDTFDFGPDNDVDIDDVNTFLPLMEGPQ